MGVPGVPLHWAGWYERYICTGALFSQHLIIVVCWWYPGNFFLLQTKHQMCQVIEHQRRSRCSIMSIMHLNFLSNPEKFCYLQVCQPQRTERCQRCVVSESIVRCGVCVCILFVFFKSRSVDRGWRH